VDLVMPQDLFENLRMGLLEDGRKPTHYRVIMKLEDALTGEFFTQYIKIGTANQSHQLPSVTCRLVDANSRQAMC
jgi:hypothetical protein